MRLFALLGISLLGACSFYFGADDPPKVCPDEVATRLRDPATGQCEEFPSVPCLRPDVALRTIPLPGWPPCDSACSGLGEATCLATAGCQASYHLIGKDSIPRPHNYDRCFATAGEEGATLPCEQRTADQCVASDQCSLVYDGSSGAHCLAEVPNYIPPPTCVVPGAELVNPYSGECEIVGPRNCDGTLDAQYADWAPCDSTCSGLEETSCLETAGCRGIYQPVKPVHTTRRFLHCVAVAPSGPTHGACEGEAGGLDDYECSRHDDCSWVTGRGCIPEVFCPIHIPASRLVRNPATNSCEGDYSCADHSDWAECFESSCESLGEAQCRTTNGCRAIYGETYTAQVGAMPIFQQCVPTAPSGPIHDGSCQDLDAQQCSRHDNCFAVHEPRVCFDAPCDQPFLYCAPEAPPPPTCPELADEADCITAACEPLYEGKDCHCDDSGCGCTNWEFVSCQDITPPPLEKTCGGGLGDIGEVCPGGYFCDYADDWCGWNDGVGTCQPVPEHCPEDYNPVCGCDGKQYGNLCAAHAAGMDEAVHNGESCEGD